jgi:hypothetical protein
MKTITLTFFLGMLALTMYGQTGSIEIYVNEKPVPIKKNAVPCRLKCMNNDT